jgi:ABC-type branched-subunit amino acid transport system substrate-binding protein
MTMTKYSVSKSVRRRTVLGGMAAAGAFSLAGPYVARAQQGDINIGVLLPFTGSQGAYGPDMRKAAELTTKIINDAGGIMDGRFSSLVASIRSRAPGSATSITAACAITA